MHCPHCDLGRRGQRGLSDPDLSFLYHSTARSEKLFEQVCAARELLAVVRASVGGVDAASIAHAQNAVARAEGAMRSIGLKATYNPSWWVHDLISMHASPH